MRAGPLREIKKDRQYQAQHGMEEGAGVSVCPLGNKLVHKDLSPSKVVRGPA